MHQLGPAWFGLRQGSAPEIHPWHVPPQNLAAERVRPAAAGGSFLGNAFQPEDQCLGMREAADWLLQCGLHDWCSEGHNKHTRPVMMDCSHLQEGGASMAATAGPPPLQCRQALVAGGAWPGPSRPTCFLNPRLRASSFFLSFFFAGRPQAPAGSMQPLPMQTALQAALCRRFASCATGSARRLARKAALQNLHLQASRLRQRAGEGSGSCGSLPVQAPFRHLCLGPTAKRARNSHPPLSVSSHDAGMPPSFLVAV